MTKQETFNKVVAHLRNQGQQSINDIGICMYRAPNGNKCAIGCLIPDELYKPEMERKNSSALLDFFPDLKNVLNLDKFFYSELQGIHDQVSPASWEMLFMDFAARYNLDYIAPNYPNRD